MTYNEKTDQTVLGPCPFNPLYSVHGAQVYVTLPKNVSELDDFVCGHFNRRGQLCGDCLPGYCPSVLSRGRDCVRTCGSRRYLVLTLVFVAQILLAVLLLTCITGCGLDVFGGGIGSFVFFSQLISLPILANFILTLGELLSPGAAVFAKVLLTFYGIWNLQFLTLFLTDFCLHENALTTYILALDYILPLCLLFLIIAVVCARRLCRCKCRLIVCLSTPFLNHRILKVLSFKFTTVSALVTLLVLSYTRIVNTSLQLLYWVRPVESESTGRASLFYDPSMKYAGRKHLPFLILAVFVLVVFVFLPVLLLTCYQLRVFRKCLGLARLNHKGLATFVKTFQQSYRNGSYGEGDRRYFAGLYLLLRILFAGLMLWSYTSTLPNFIIVLISLVFVLLVSFVRPHQKVLHNVVHALMFSVVLAIFATILNTLSLRFQSTGARPDTWESLSIAIILALLALPAAGALVAMALLLCAKLKVRSPCERTSSGSPPQSPAHESHETFMYSERSWSPLVPEDYAEMTETSSMPDRVLNPCRYQSLDLLSTRDSFTVEP